MQSKMSKVQNKIHYKRIVWVLLFDFDELIGKVNFNTRNNKNVKVKQYGKERSSIYNKCYI